MLCTECQCQLSYGILSDDSFICVDCMSIKDLTEMLTYREDDEEKT